VCSCYDISSNTFNLVGTEVADEVAALRKENKRLDDENRLLTYKADLLLDMVWPLRRRTRIHIYVAHRAHAGGTSSSAGARRGPCPREPAVGTNAPRNRWPWRGEGAFPAQLLGRAAQQKPPARVTTHPVVSLARTPCWGTGLAATPPEGDGSNMCLWVRSSKECCSGLCHIRGRMSDHVIVFPKPLVPLDPFPSFPSSFWQGFLFVLSLIRSCVSRRALTKA